MVHCERSADGPRVTEVLAVEDLAGGVEATQFTATPLFVRDGPDDVLAWTGQIPIRLERHLRRAGIDIRALLDDTPHGAQTHPVAVR